MTKQEVANEVAVRTGLTKEDALKGLEASIGVIAHALQNGKSVYIRGFGSFTVKERAAKLARNISKNTTIEIPVRRVPVLKFSKDLKSKVNNFTAQPF